MKAMNILKLIQTLKKDTKYQIFAVFGKLVCAWAHLAHLMHMPELIKIMFDYSKCLLKFPRFFG
jgi:hypothetical protein